MKARIVTFDIENFANLLYSWQSKSYKGSWNSIGVEIPWHILCFAYKWYSEAPQVVSLPQFRGYKPMIVRKKSGVFFRFPNDKPLMLAMWKILDEADIVVGWNSTRFDIKKVNARMIVHGMKPPSPYKQIDVMAQKKRVTLSNSNKLDDTGEEWGTGRKLPNTGWNLWMGCAEGDPKAWAKMERYNVQDVILTEKNYTVLRPWMPNHPNVNHYSRDIKACSTCGKENTLIRKGWRPAGQRRRQIHYCAPNRGGCGKYCTGDFIPQDPEKKLIIVR